MAHHRRQSKGNRHANDVTRSGMLTKTFNAETGAAWLVSTMDMQTLAELGFIVVQIDGMGTANRSKAFHNVAWKNLADDWDDDD